jgi:alkylhydroperoxidase/carboxymuconolactone decarboxylase family protein YurZ
MGIVTVDLKELCPKIHDGLERIWSVAFRDGRIVGKEKLLIALAIAASVKCEPCIRMYAERV